MEQSENLQSETVSTQRVPPLEVIKHKNWWKIGFFVLVVLFLIVLVSFAYFLVNIYGQKKLPVSSLTPIVVPTSSVQLTLESILEEMKSNLSKKFSVSGVEDSEFNWLREDNYAIGVKGKSVEIFESEEFADINSKIEASLTSKGFTKSSMNSYSYDHYDTGPLSYTLAFENNQIKCLAEWRKGFISPSKEHENPFYKIFCGIYDKQSDPLDEILPALNPGGLYSLSKKLGNYAIGDSRVFPCCTGAFWLTVKEGSQWKLVFEGQESPACEIVDKYKIPQEIYENCYENISGKLRF